MTNAQIGANVRALRKKRGYTIGKMCRLLSLYGQDVSESLAGSWERGERRMNVMNLWAVSKVLDCSMDTLMEETAPDIDHQRINVELHRMSDNERLIVHHGVTQWDGDVHALICANGMYMRLPEAFRFDVVSVLISMYLIAQRRNLLCDAPYHIDMDMLSRKWENLHA